MSLLYLIVDPKALLDIAVCELVAIGSEKLGAQERRRVKDIVLFGLFDGGHGSLATIHGETRKATYSFVEFGEFDRDNVWMFVSLQLEKSGFLFDNLT